MRGFTFDQETHIGRMNGVIWPSVTQLLQEFKLIDYSMVPEEVLERKRILGTRVHAATGLLDDCNLDEEHFNREFPDAVPYLDAYRKFRLVEHFDQAFKRTGRMFSQKWRFHGEPDEHGVVWAVRGKENYLIDYKCTFKMFASTGAQLSGYEILLAEKFKIKINKRFGLLLKPNGNFDLTEFKDPNDKQDFLACLWLSWQKREKYKTTGVMKNDKSANGTGTDPNN